MQQRKQSAEKNIMFFSKKAQIVESQSQKLAILKRIIQERDLLRYLQKKELR